MRRPSPAATARVAVSAALLVGLVWWTGPEKLADAVGGMSWSLFAAAVGANYLALALGAANIVLLTRIVLPVARTDEASRAYARSWAVGMVAPGRFGDLSYAHFLSGDDANLAPGLAVAVVDKIVTFVVTSIIAVVGLALYVGAADALYGALFAAAATAATVAALLNGRIRGLVRERLLGRHAERFAGFAGHVSTLMFRSRAAIAINTTLTVARMLAYTAVVALSLAALGARPPFADVFVVQAVTQLVSLVPITFAGLGVRQGASVVLFERISGVAAAPVLGSSLLMSFVSYLNAALVFAVLGGERRR